MPIEIGNGISHAVFPVEEFAFPWYLASAITNEHVGRAVALDATASRTVKLAGDGDMVIGVLDSYEDRVSEGVKVGTVTHKGGRRVSFPTTGVTFAVGDRVIGAGSGLVKPHVVAANATGAVPMPLNLVTAVDATNKRVEVLFL